MCYYFDWGDGSSGLEKKNYIFQKVSTLLIEDSHGHSVDGNVT